MTKRRGKGEGSIFQRADGSWQGSIETGYRKGRRLRKYVSGATRADVVKKLTKVLRDRHQELPVVDERATVGQYLERWLSTTAAAKLRPRTLASYRQIVDTHIVPSLGSTALAKLRPDQVQAWLAEIQEDGLSARTAAYCRAVLRSALTVALRWGLVARNVAALVEPPRVVRKEMRALTADQANSLLKAAAGHRLESLITVALVLGLRLGELVALRWLDVDLTTATPTLRVEGALQRMPATEKGSAGHLERTEPKTERSRRSLALPAIVVSALKHQRRKQQESRLLAGDLWQNTGYVFTSTIGTPLEPRNVSREFHDVLETTKLPRMRFHDLRHSAATLLLSQGVHARVLMEILGHAAIGTTLGTYSHVPGQLQAEALGRLDDVLKRPRSRKRPAQVVDLASRRRKSNG